MDTLARDGNVFSTYEKAKTSVHKKGVTEFGLRRTIPLDFALEWKPLTPSVRGKGLQPAARATRCPIRRNVVTTKRKTRAQRHISWKQKEIGTPHHGKQAPVQKKKKTLEGETASFLQE